MIPRGTSQDILWKFGCETSLHVHRQLMFRAMYNKHTAAVSTGHNADRPCFRFATIERVTAMCKMYPDVMDMALRRATQERTAYASDYLAFAIKAA